MRGRRDKDERKKRQGLEEEKTRVRGSKDRDKRKKKQDEMKN